MAASPVVAQLDMPSPLATRQLVALYQRDMLTAADADALREAVLAGADVMLSHQAVFSLHQPILHALISREAVEAVKACLLSPLVISFVKVTNYRKENLLHLLCRTRLEILNKMLPAVVYRIETHPNDIVNWSQKNVFKQDFITLAATLGKLSVVWPHVKHVPHFADNTEGIDLGDTRMFEMDWSKLSEAEQENFVGGRRMAPTEALHWIAQQTKPDVSIVQSCVDHDADIMYTANHAAYSPSFHLLVSRGAVDCVKACLTTRQSIDFTMTNYLGDKDNASPTGPQRERLTPLHLLCLLRSRDVAVEMLTAILVRLGIAMRNEGTNQQMDAAAASADETRRDKIDWGQTDHEGQDFLSCAKANGKLLVFWPLLRHLSYFKGMSFEDE